MDKRIVIGILTAAVLFILGILAYVNLEIYPRRVPVFPSRDAITNNFFAMERWLGETGHPVRVEKKGSVTRIVSGAEQAALVQADVCSWENAGVLIPWIKKGGFLLVTLNYDFYDEDLYDFLSGLGIKRDSYLYWDDDEENEDLENEEGDEMSDTLADMENSYSTDDDSSETVPIPDFDRYVQLFVDETADADGLFTIKDNEGLVRLVWVSLGEGALVVTGEPRFMYNSYLEYETNARLAWDLTGARTTAENPGLLFIHGKPMSKSLFGKLADRGNFFPPAASAFILIILGFWMVIPVFGLVFSEREKRARSIGERFLAEVRFLKKYGALQSYLEVYVRELKLRGRADEITEIEEALQSGRRLKYREIIEALDLFENLVSSRTKVY